MTCSRLSIAAFAALAGVLTLAPTALAARDDRTPLKLPEDAPARTAESAGGGSLVRTIVGLAIVIGVIYGLYWVLRQVKSSREERSVGSGLASQAVVPLGPNRSLHLVRAGRELVLLGVAEHGVTPIRSYTEEEAQLVGLIGENGSEPDGELEPLPEPGRRRHPSGAMTIGDLVDRIRLWTVRK